MSAPSTAKTDAPELTYEILKQAVEGRAAALRCRRVLQPVGGTGDKVFPPTFAGAVYAIEKRRLPDYPEPVTCVLLDSVQSQANRMEQALQEAVDSDRIRIPIIAVDFTEFAPTGDQERDQKEKRLIQPIDTVTSLQVPHRLADAILRDSEYKEVDGNALPFRESSIGKHIDDAKPLNATPIYQLCPTALIFGMWDSTGPKGGLGAKFERALVSEIIGVDASFGLRVGSRIDPIITKPTGIIVYKRIGGGWTAFADQAEKSKDGEPVKLGKKNAGKVSNANLGNVLPTFATYEKGASGPNPLLPKQPPEQGFEDARQGSIAPGGVTISHALQTITLSLASMRRLSFPVAQTHDSDLDNSARTVLAALGLYAASAAFSVDVPLRSRCHLRPEGPMIWELLDQPGKDSPYSLSPTAAERIFKNAADAAEAAGLDWHAKEPIRLTPSADLLYVVRRSQLNALNLDAEED